MKMKKYIIPQLVLILSPTLSPAQSMVPKKYLDRQMTIEASTGARFSEAVVRNGDFVKHKNLEWRACRRTHEKPVFFTRAKDDLPGFLEASVQVATLEEMESQKLKRAQVSLQPWSGDYWAIADGVLASRFQDEEFNRLADWKTKSEFIKQSPMETLLELKGQEAVSKLSPAEKYDLLIGASDSAFTAAQWDIGQPYYDEKGTVESWMGICHGWAPAAIMEKRPVHSVDLPSADGKWQVHFNPSEVKGILSYSWATNHFPTVSLGERCYKKNPRRDNNGHLVDPECFDLNPATWHQAIVNMVGIADRSFVMDATYDYEVWNQPVIGYEYTYFNLNTQKRTDSLNEAQVAKSDYRKDPFAQYRSRDVVKLVGIEMRVGYVSETSANSSETDDADADSIIWVQYRYDLELDQKDRIIGGEWHQVAHPDFIWTPQKDVQALSGLDLSLSPEGWSDGLPMPTAWSKAARAGAGQGVLLNTISESILNKTKSP
jgi:hypothetical protein